MNCPHTDTPCKHVSYCGLTAPDAKVEACSMFLPKIGTNRPACINCSLKPCRFSCFRQRYESMSKAAFEALDERREAHEHARQNTPYRKMLRSGELEAQRRTTAAALQKQVQNTLDTDAQRGV